MKESDDPVKINKILVVDDSQMARNIISKVLADAGYHVMPVQSPLIALEQIELDKNDEISLILTDVEMPKMNGIEFCAQVKGNERSADIPVVVITTLDKTEVIEKAFNAGAADFINKPFRKIELLARVRSLLKLKAEISIRREREAELLKREQDLLDVNRMLEFANQTVMLSASIDSLTGITNRRTFDNFMSIEWPRAQRSHSAVSVAMIDIDFFKNYNDNYGHQAGDECLKKVSAAMKGSLPRGNAIFARYGGEEFILFVPGLEKGEAVAVAESLRAAVERCAIPHAFSSAGKTVSVSIGIAWSIASAETTIAEITSEADKRLYHAKEQGRNRVAFPEID